MKKFFVPFKDDKRMLYACEKLEKNGFEQVKSVENCDTVILPVPTKEKHIKDIKNKFVYCAKINEKMLRSLNQNGNEVYDCFNDESYVLKNAFLTAEGIVAMLIENSDRSLFSSSVLITGYGRIAKATAKILSSCGADITICSRSEVSKAQVKFDGYKHIFFNELKNNGDFDFIINTVDDLVFCCEELKSIKKDALLLDVASFPGGVDELSAKALSVSLIYGPALPSKFSVKTAGELIADAIIVNEE